MLGTMTSAGTSSSKQKAVDQKTDERRRAAEVKQKESDNRFTSPELIRAIEDSFGPIDFDPCWHEASAVRPGAYLDVRQGHNGLRDEWAGRLAFVNPPWSSQDKWVKRGHDQWAKGNATTVLCLVPAKTDTKFFHAILATEADVYFLEGRPRFFKEDGTSEATMVSTMLVMFGASDEQKIRFSELVRGSWWLPSRSSPILVSELGTGGPYAFRSCSVSSCVTSYPRSLIIDTVLCAPLNERACRTHI
ncbi:hypothetical protein ASE78_17435 [Sphingomonas sp. Leaf25]|nr:hypothetical protein ASE78_17435 [Sphingomonas sp. Leaf25]